MRWLTEKDINHIVSSKYKTRQDFEYDETEYEGADIRSFEDGDSVILLVMVGTWQMAEDGKGGRRRCAVQ